MITAPTGCAPATAHLPAAHLRRRLAALLGALALVVAPLVPGSAGAEEPCTLSDGTPGALVDGDGELIEDDAPSDGEDVRCCAPAADGTEGDAEEALDRECPEDIDTDPEDIDADPEDIDADPEDADADPEDADADPEDADADPEDPADPADPVVTPSPSISAPTPPQRRPSDLLPDEEPLVEAPSVTVPPLPLPSTPPPSADVRRSGSAIASGSATPLPAEPSGDGIAPRRGTSERAFGSRELAGSERDALDALAPDVADQEFDLGGPGEPLEVPVPTAAAPAEEPIPEPPVSEPLVVDRSGRTADGLVPAEMALGLLLGLAGGALGLSFLPARLRGGPPVEPWRRAGTPLSPGSALSAGEAPTRTRRGRRARPGS